MTVTTYSKYINVGYSPFIQIYDFNTLIAQSCLRAFSWTYPAEDILERLENYTYRPAAKPGEQSSLPAGADSVFHATCMQTSYTVIWVLFQAANKATSTTASTQQTSKTNTVCRKGKCSNQQKTNKYVDRLSKTSIDIFTHPEMQQISKFYLEKMSTFRSDPKQNDNSVQ